MIYLSIALIFLGYLAHDAFKRWLNRSNEDLIVTFTEAESLELSLLRDRLTGLELRELAVNKTLSKITAAASFLPKTRN